MSVDPSVHNDISGAVAGPVIQVGNIHMGVHLHPEPVTPRQLPAVPGLFTGRIGELAHLSEILPESRTGVPIAAVVGAGGIGKTWLALTWAHQHADRFPDGQLFVDLHGFDPTMTPVPSAVAIRGFLDALAVDPVRTTSDADGQVGLYRSLIAERRMLILLDNAIDTAQVVPLLPGTSTCAVIVTSRNRLTGLINAHGARSVAVDALSPADAHSLLTRRLGDRRLKAEPSAVNELVRRCAGLPLALGILAGRAATHPQFALATLAAELRDDATRLSALDDGDPSASLRAVLEGSYRALSPQQAEVLTLLGLAFGPDIEVRAAAELTGRTTRNAAEVLCDLERFSLAQQHVPGRFHLHDLVRLDAAQRAHANPARQRAASSRLLDYYVRTSYIGDRLLSPHRAPIHMDVSSTDHPFDDEAQALAWFAAEHACLLAAQKWAIEHERYAATWQLAWTMSNFHYRCGHLHDDLAVWEAGLGASQSQEDPSVRSLAYRRLGHARSRLGCHTEAIDDFRRALELAEDQSSLADCYRLRSIAWEIAGDDANALEDAARARELFRAAGNPVWEAHALSQMGWYSARLHRFPEGRLHCEAALEIFRRHDLRDGTADVLDSLGFIAHYSGRHAEALTRYGEALSLCDDSGNTYTAADILDHLGDAHAELDHRREAFTLWQRAKDLYADQRRIADVKRVEQKTSSIGLPQNETERVRE